MAVNYKDVKRKIFDKKLEKKQDKRQQFRAVITDALGNQSGAGDIWFNRLQRKVWAMPNGGTQPFPYNCFRIKPTIGLGVIIGYSSPLNQLVEVLQTDTEFLGPSNTTGTAYESPDNEDFLPGGRLQLWLDTRLIQSLAIYPDSSGLFVNVTNGDYIYQNERKTFDGEENIDLSGSQPAGPNEHLYVGLYLDSSNALQTVDGATVATSATAPEPTWPTGSYRLGMVLLDDTQTRFSMADDIVNLKIPWTDEESFSSGAWPNAGEIKIGDTIYASLAAAQAVAVSPNVVKLGEGSYPSNNLTFATGVSFASAGNATITQTSDANCMTLTNATIRGINFSVSINSANTRSTLTFVDTCYAYNVRISGSNAGAGVVDGFAYADTEEVYLGDCESIVDGDAVNINNVDAIVTIANGIYSGGTGGIEVVAGFANLLFPHVASNNVTANPASRGQWFDSTSNTRVETQARFQDSSVTAPIRITERATAPSSPATQDIYLDTGANFTPGPSGLMRYNGSTWAGVGGDFGVLLVKNTSGATAVAGEVGYLIWVSGSGWEYKTTTTPIDDKAEYACVVIAGAANNSNIRVSQVGRYTVGYNGTAPSQGDVLVFASAAGDLTRSTVMRPEIVAIAMAAGSGGTVDAMLMTRRVTKLASDTHFMYGLAGASDSDFTSTIATLPGGAVLTYGAVTTGNENAIDPWAALDAAFNAKLMIHNTTRGTSAIISAVVVGTNTITLTANVPAGWTVGDTITARSQTNTQNWSGGSYYFEYDISGWADKPPMATAIIIEPAIQDTGGVGISSFHPYSAFVSSKNYQRWTQNTAARFIAPVTVPLINNRFCLGWDASGSATVTAFAQLAGWIIAVP